MPETPVYENDQTQGPPNDVRLASVVGLRPDVDAIPNAPRVKNLPYQQFRLSVAAALLAHTRTR